MNANGKRMLVACEFSGRVRDAFAAQGWDAWSCDLLPTEAPGQHYQCDVREVLNEGWDLMIAHPPCTYLAVSGNRHIPCNPARWGKRYESLMFVWELFSADIKRIAIENPVSVLSTYLRKPDQIVHPYFFGDKEAKKTCLWLKGLPVLHATDMVEPEFELRRSKKNKSGFSKYSRTALLGPGKGHQRSITFPGIARAMAEQWTKYIILNE